MINEGIKLRGYVALILRDKNGNIKEDRKVKNLIVDTGLNFICDRMKDDETAMTHMALGSGTTAAAAGDSALGSEVARVALTSTTVSSNTVTYVATFGAGTPSSAAAVTEAGLLNASSAGTMLCRTVFDVVNKGTADSMTITWTVTVS